MFRARSHVDVDWLYDRHVGALVGAQRRVSSVWKKERVKKHDRKNENNGSDGTDAEGVLRTYGDGGDDAVGECADCLLRRILSSVR